jgi:hypothetical protein
MKLTMGLPRGMISASKPRVAETVLLGPNSRVVLHFLGQMINPPALDTGRFHKYTVTCQGVLPPWPSPRAGSEPRGFFVEQIKKQAPRARLNSVYWGQMFFIPPSRVLQNKESLTIVGCGSDVKIITRVTKFVNDPIVALMLICRVSNTGFQSRSLIGGQI